MPFSGISKITRAGLVMAASALTLAAVAHAQPPEGAPLQSLFNEMQLTKSQRSAIAELRGEIPRNRGAVTEHRSELRELIKAGKVDEAVDLATRRAAARVRRAANFRAELKQILTKDQLARVDQLIESRSRRGQRKFGDKPVH